MKRLIMALGTGAVVFGGIFGLAASLNVTSSTLGAGAATVAACQTGTINVTYAPTYDGSVPAYSATTVTLNGLDTSASACGNKSYKVSLVTNDDASLGEYTGTTPSSGTAMSVTATGVEASAVEGVHVTIYG